MGFLIGFWAIAPPYVVLFGRLEVKNSTVELVDHALPGLMVVAASVFGYLQLRADEPSQLLLFTSGATIALGGFWMLSTHVGLLGQTRQGLVPGGAVAWHIVPGVAVTVLGLAWSACFWSDESGEKT